MLDYLTDFLKENGIDYYRQDFNCHELELIFEKEDDIDDPSGYHIITFHITVSIADHIIMVTKCDVAVVHTCR